MEKKIVWLAENTSLSPQNSTTTKIIMMNLHAHPHSKETSKTNFPADFSSANPVRSNQERPPSPGIRAEPLLHLPLLETCPSKVPLEVLPNLSQPSDKWLQESLRGEGTVKALFSWKRVVKTPLHPFLPQENATAWLTETPENRHDESKALPLMRKQLKLWLRTPRPPSPP